MSGLMRRAAPLMPRAVGVCRETRNLKGKSNASARWVRRQWSDPVVKQAKREGLRSRAAFKLRELNSKYQLIKRGDVVLDLGAAPGGWTQVAVEAAGTKRPPQPPPTHKNQQSRGEGPESSAAAPPTPPPRLPSVVAVDLKAFAPVDGAAIVVGDFRRASVREEIAALLAGRRANVVLSDMAPSFSGTFFTDSQAQLRLCHNALKMAELYLRPGGHFATKVLRCDGAEEFRAELKARFEVVKGMKPQSSRQESTEMFLVAKGFKGPVADDDTNK